jgi:hypothetical protein
MNLKIFFVVRERNDIMQYEAGPFTTRLAASYYIREQVPATDAAQCKVVIQNLDVEYA